MLVNYLSYTFHIRHFSEDVLPLNFHTYLQDTIFEDTYAATGDNEEC
jgi:hypothetical protein